MKIKHLLIAAALLPGFAFESHSLNREKVIAPNAKATIFVGPLKPGRYPFVGEFHEKTAKGVIVAE
jgi:hypothetical protein